MTMVEERSIYAAEMARSLCKLLLLHHLLLPLILVLKLQFNQTHASSSSSFSSIFTTISKNQFPPGFVFGAGTSALQIEGAAFEDGKAPSIWDTFAHDGRTIDKSTGDVAADQYHRYKEDVRLMHDMGLDAYRFSISWSRLIPDGRGAINPKGLQYYNDLINELMSYGIEAHVTLLHFDVPQALEDDYGGLLSPKIIEDFTSFADVCFREFGDRVSSWTTFNEPNILTLLGYGIGIFPPGRCSYSLGLNCSSTGNSSMEVYITAHNMLLSHAAAANLYKEKYQEKQQGLIGITILAFWFEPATNSSEDVIATQRIIDLQLGWFLDPLIYEDYPSIMRKIVGPRLPSISEEESKQLKGSFDFIGLNHYTVMYVKNYNGSWKDNKHEFLRDAFAKVSIFPNFVELDKKDLSSLKVMALAPQPWALQKLLEYIKLYYKNPLVIIHENGLGTHGDISLASKLEDVERVNYIQGYIEALLPSLRNGSNVRGYFVWSFLDCFELNSGYTAHFGLVQVDHRDNDLKRYPRLSSRWYANFLGKNIMNWGTSNYVK